MPVTVHPAPHGANAMKASSPTASSRDLLRTFVPDKKIKNDHILQSSLQNLRPKDKIYPATNGFVDGAVKAYNEHYHLELRPDDIWVSILAQLSIYINAHSEELRDMFVSHEGQKHLEIIELEDIQGNKDNVFGVDWGKFSYKMSKMIAANIKDPSLREWILPCFSTTTKDDQAVASILMMATLQKFFSYGCGILCGLPSVTLLGRKEDWEKLVEKAERLTTFGDEPIIWHSLLKPVLERFVTSFDSPEAEEIKDFWQKIAHYSGGGSGPSYLSGWITAFCFWDNKGKCLHIPNENPSSKAEMSSMGSPTPVLQLDEARYHRVDTEAIPAGWASVPVELNDNGMITPCVMVAGAIGMKFSKSGNLETGIDTLSVQSGWWMYETYDKKEMAEAKKERRRLRKEERGHDYDSDWL